MRTPMDRSCPFRSRQGGVDCRSRGPGCESAGSKVLFALVVTASMRPVGIHVVLAGLIPGALFVHAGSGWKLPWQALAKDSERSNINQLRGLTVAIRPMLYYFIT